MSVDIDPSELGFHRPFNHEVSQILKIKNPNQTPVAFKVKTTAPKQYCVRPNSGKIEAGREVEVSVLLQAMKTEPAPDAKCRDKFLVQSVAIDGDQDFTNGNAIWQQVDGSGVSTVQEKKIRVVFLPAAGDASLAILNTPLKPQSAPQDQEPAPPAYSNRSPSPDQAYTPETRKISTPSGPISRVEEKPSSSKNLGEIRASATNPATSSSVADTAAATVEDLKAKLADAQATIAAYGREGGVRLRKVAAGETSNATVNQVATKIQANEGVPVQICAALCFLSFLIAYLLF